MLRGLWNLRASTTLSILVPALVALLASPSALAGERTLVNPPWKHTLGLHRVGQRHLDIYSGYRKTFLAPGGVAAVKHDFNDKPGRGDDDELTVYGLNTGTGEMFCNKSMTALEFVWAKSDDLSLHGAAGIAANRSGDVFVSERERDVIVHLRNNASGLSVVDTFDLASSGQRLDAPGGIAADSTSWR